MNHLEPICFRLGDTYWKGTRGWNRYVLSDVQTAIAFAIQERTGSPYVELGCFHLDHHAERFESIAYGVPEEPCPRLAYRAFRPRRRSR